jgi:hypothetical protein
MEKQTEAQNADTQQATQGRPFASWASILLDYFDQKARLLAVESKRGEQSFHRAFGSARDHACSRPL